MVNGYSAGKNRLIIRYWLDHPLVVNTDLQYVKHIMIDGTFLIGRTGILAVMDASFHKIIAGRYGIAENSSFQVKRFIESLQKAGLYPASCVSDGNPQVIRVIKELWPNIIMQRCLVHIQRQGLMWCRRFPKRTDSKLLRELFLQVVSITNQDECTNFLIQLYLWEKRYGSLIAMSKERGRVFSDIGRARSMLIKAIPDMFHYLDNPDILKSTNGLEGYFSRLKAKYRQHRGLSKDRRFNYFQWYFTICRR